MWKRHRRFSEDGTWDKIHQALLSRADHGGDIEWTVSVDSTINRAHQHATNLPRDKKNDEPSADAADTAADTAAGAVVGLLASPTGG